MHFICKIGTSVPDPQRPNAACDGTFCKLIKIFLILFFNESALFGNGFAPGHRQRSQKVRDEGGGYSVLFHISPSDCVATGHPSAERFRLICWWEAPLVRIKRLHWLALSFMPECFSFCRVEENYCTPAPPTMARLQLPRLRAFSEFLSSIVLFSLCQYILNLWRSLNLLP